MHLGLAAQAAKRPGEDDAVMVFVKRAAPQFFWAVQGLSRRSRVSRVGQSKAGTLRAVNDVPQLPGSAPWVQEKLQAGGIDIDKQQALTVIEELPGSQAVLVGGGVAIGGGQRQATLFPAFCQQVIKIRTPRPVMAQIATVGLPGALAPFEVGRQLGAMPITLIKTQQPGKGG